MRERVLRVVVVLVQIVVSVLGNHFLGFWMTGVGLVLGICGQMWVSRTCATKPPPAALPWYGDETRSLELERETGLIYDGVFLLPGYYHEAPRLLPTELGDVAVVKCWVRDDDEGTFYLPNGELVTLDRVLTAKECGEWRGRREPARSGMSPVTIRSASGAIIGPKRQHQTIAEITQAVAEAKVEVERIRVEQRTWPDVR